MPMRGERSIPAMPAISSMRAAERTWPQVFGILGSPDLVIVAFSAIGLLVTIIVAASFEAFSSVLEIVGSMF